MYSNLILFYIIFFIVAYIKKYCPKISNNNKANIICAMISITCFIVFLTLMNVYYLKNPILNGNMQYWNKNNNPFLLLFSLSLFNIFKNIKIRSKLINLISSLSLYIYLIHENLLIKKYTRVFIWAYIYNRFSYKHIILEIFIYSLLLMFSSIIASLFYKYTINKILNEVINKVFNNKKVKETYEKLEKKLLIIK